MDRSGSTGFAENDTDAGKPEVDVDVDVEKKQQPPCDVDSNDVVANVVKNGDALGRSKSASASKTGRISHGNAVKYSRIFKKVSPDGNLVLFLPQREIMVTETKVEPLMGVALIHQSVMKTQNIKVFLQVVLTFR